MILQSLVRHYETLAADGKITVPGWSMAKVSYALELSRTGDLIGVIPLKQEELRGKKTVTVPRLIPVPQQVSRSSGTLANFLCDNTSYILGIDKKGKPERSLECFDCARKKHLEILGSADSEAAFAVRSYFEKWNPQKAADNDILSGYLEEMMDGANLIFIYDGEFVQEDPLIKQAWENYRAQPGDSVEGICLVTGRRTEIARIHTSIKGVQGAQSSGAALVSFNAPAFESYGKEQSYNAPVGVYAAYAYTAALNYLLADREHLSVIGDTTVVYWSEDGNSDYQNVFAAAADPVVDNQDIVHGVFKNLEMGKAIDADGVQSALSLDQPFFILGLTPNAARLSVRFFYQDSFGSILKHIKEHYDRMEIVRPETDRMQYLGIWRMLQETVNKKSRDKKPAPNMAGAVYRSLIAGDRYPEALYQSVLIRIRAEQDDSDSRIYKITRGRAAVIKAFLLKNRGYSEKEVTMALNEESSNAAYVLGREFSVLEAIQMEANPLINATIKDRYFNAACATPASIFPILFKLKNSHIRKIKNTGRVIYYEKLLGNLQEKLTVQGGNTSACPRRLSLEEQGMFILGYYHQTQKRYEKKAKEEE